MKSQTASASVTGGPPVSKKEKIVPQATAEQLRIAEITNVSSEQDSAELHKNIKNVVEFTGRSQDEAAMALHDSNGDVQEAINLLLEQSSDVSAWETSGKKKKEKAVVEIRKEDTRRSGDDRGNRNRPRGPKAVGGAPPGTRGKPGRVPGQRFPREGRPGGPGQKGGRRNNTENQPQNNNEDNTWNNGSNEFEEQTLRKENGENPGQANDTIGNMGNWDDFKADQKNTSEWSGGRKEKLDWADVASAGNDRDRDWKTGRHRQPPNPNVKGGPQKQTESGTRPDGQQQKPTNPTDSVTNSVQNLTAAQRVAARPQQTPPAQSARTKVRLPPTSKIPQTPVEMPPDHLDLHGGNSLDVTFGGLSFGSSSYDAISSNIPQNHHKTNKVDHNGGSLASTTGHLVQSHQTQSVQQNVPHIKSQQSSQQVVDVSKSSLQSTDRGSATASMNVPPGLDKSAVNSPQTHKSMSQAQAAVSAQVSSASPYHAAQVSNPSNSSTSASNYPQYSSSYKQQSNNMAYLHNLYTNHSTSQYSQPTGQYGTPTNYGTSFAGTTGAAGGYKSKEGTLGNSSNSSVSAVADSVSSATSGYDNKKNSNLQAQQAHQQALQSGAMVLQQGHLPGHMHAAASYAHLTGHPGMGAMYSYYTHPGQMPPQPGSGTHLATDYQQGQRESSSTSTGTSAGISSSLLQQQQQQQQHSYDKFVRSQDDSSSGSAVTQGSTTAGSQSTITAAANYAHMGPYNIYYGAPVVTPQGTFPGMPFVSAQVAAGYPTTGNANSSSQPSKTNSGYGTGNSAFDYQLGHLSSAGGDYNKYQSNKMMSNNSNKYISATTASERR